jgi:hypothetical protein
VVASVAVGQKKRTSPPKVAPIVKPRDGKSETIKLFDGKTLDGWEGYSDLWSVHDGMIVAKNSAPLKYSTYLLTKKKFSDFRLTFACKLLEGSDMHSGVAFWGEVWPKADGKVTDPKGRGVAEGRRQGNRPEEGPQRVHVQGPPRDVPVRIRDV